MLFPLVLPPDKFRILQKPPWACCYSHVLVEGQTTQESLALKLRARAFHRSEEMKHLRCQSLPKQLAYSSRGKKAGKLKAGAGGRSAAAAPPRGPGSVCQEHRASPRCASPPAPRKVLATNAVKQHLKAERSPPGISTDLTSHIIYPPHLPATSPGGAAAFSPLKSAWLHPSRSKISLEATPAPGIFLSTTLPFGAKPRSS